MAPSHFFPSPLSLPYTPLSPPAAADHLLDQLSVVCDGLLGFPWGNLAENRGFLHRYIHPQEHYLRKSRTPQLSVLGLASLLLGISATLMMFGSFAFLLGLMLMPFILPLAFVASICVLLAIFKTSLLDFCSFSPLSSASSSNDPIMLAKLGF